MSSLWKLSKQLQKLLAYGTKQDGFIVVRAICCFLSRKSKESKIYVFSSEFQVEFYTFSM